MAIERVEYVEGDIGDVQLWVTIAGRRGIIPGDFPTRLLAEGLVPVVPPLDELAELEQAAGGGSPIRALTDPALVAVVKRWAGVQGGDPFTWGDQATL